MLLGFEFESYEPDRVNFSCPQIGTRSNQAHDARYNLHSILEDISDKGSLDPSQIHSLLFLSPCLEHLM